MLHYMKYLPHRLDINRVKIRLNACTYELRCYNAHISFYISLRDLGYPDEYQGSCTY
jgi:hypothetical protein